MPTAIKPSLVKHFVRETLGCQCPDSVFEQIDHRVDWAIAGQTMAARRLLVGNRLLIYILEPESPDSLDAVLPTLVQEAKAERDCNGFNRVRIVIAADPVERFKAQSERIFAGIEAVDSKVHLHVLPKGTLGGWS